MNPKTYILSTCGTSLLTNKIPQDLRDLLNQYTNTKHPEQIPPSDRQILQQHLHDRQQHLLSTDLTTATQLSAELKSILSLYNNQPHNHPQHFHHLLSTDTWLGEQAAKILQTWLQNYHLTTTLTRQTDLQTQDIQSFQLALCELAQTCRETIQDYRKQGYNIIFNLTGGFKGVQGFLQTLGMFYADEILYIFERSDSLLRIPRLPLSLNPDPLLLQHLTTFRRLSLNLAPLPNTDLSQVPETLLLSLDDRTSLSPYADLLWAETHHTLYQQQLHPSPSPKLQYSPALQRHCQTLSPDRLQQINHRIDQLTRHLEDPQHPNPRSLDFKPLKGNPCPPSTHECDAWADLDAQRLFCHYDGPILILDKLDKGLH